VSEAGISEAAVESARREWADGHRRLLDEARERVARERLYAQVDAVVDELRRRVGAVFTLAELAREYGRAEEWSRQVVEERAPAPGWPRTLSFVEATAFHLYARGAVDYEP
jgi:hypothetical protein